MGTKIKRFWEENKDTIKNVIIVVAVPVAIAALYGVSNLNKFLEEKGLTDEYYVIDEDEEA